MGIRVAKSSIGRRGFLKNVGLNTRVKSTVFGTLVFRKSGQRPIRMSKSGKVFGRSRFVELWTKRPQRILLYGTLWLRRL